MVNKVREVRQYIDKNALWIRSANPVSIADLEYSKNAIASFFEPAKWNELALNAKAKMAKRPYESALAGFIILGMFVVSRRLKGNA